MVEVLIVQINLMLINCVSYLAGVVTSLQLTGLSLSLMIPTQLVCISHGSGSGNLVVCNSPCILLSYNLVTGVGVENFVLSCIVLY